MSQLLDPQIPAADETRPRNYTGWIAFAVLVLLTIVSMGASSSKSKPSRLEGHETDQMLFKQVLSIESLEKSIGNSLMTPSSSSRDTMSKTLDDPIAGLVIETDKDPLAAMLYAEMRTYQGQSVPVEHLKILGDSKVPADQAFYKVYTSSKLTLAQAQALIAKFPSQPFVYQAAKVQTLEKAGDTNAVTRLVSPV